MPRDDDNYHDPFKPVGTPRRLVKGIVRSLFRLPDECPVPVALKWRLGQLVGIHPAVPWPVHFTTTVHSPGRVKLGRGTYPGDSPHCYIQAINGIIVGDYTNLGPGVGLISANHDPNENNRWVKGPPIRLGRHCWLGMNSIILPGVTLGDHTIVGAGAVVTKSFPEGHCILAGNPARKLRDLEKNKE
ncbi:MAG: acyltransferase [Candidatus Sumerlaeia bacterium]|nr:acyltransferase [Candidatus Sumerlaeia bacterium]